LYDPSVDHLTRKSLFNRIGIAALVAFILVRWINVYGDPLGWKHYETFSKTLISFLNPNKYPPSLVYLLMTLGIVFLFLANSEKLRGRVVRFFSVFGRVPFFYYILHLYVIHLTALVFAQLSGFGWQKLILSGWITQQPGLKGYGFDLWVVYVVWIALIASLYPLCKRFDNYKTSHREKWWLSYL